MFLFVNVQLDLLVIHTASATNVGFFKVFYSPDLIIVNSKLIPDECLTNDDCPFDKACLSQECIDPCLQTSCGQNAQCSVEFHQSRCFCPQGLQGNPLVRCYEVGCRTDSDCRDSEKCDFSSQTCTPLCQGSPCVEGARCDARNHQEVCECIPPLKGNGKIYCERRKNLFCRQRGTCIISFNSFLKTSN